MNLRRIPAVLLVVVGIVVLVVIGSSRPAPATPVFTALGSPSTPFVPQLEFITSSWFCPGVPIGASGLGGSVVIANPNDAPLSGQVTAFTDAADQSPIATPFEVPPRDTTTLDLATVQPNGSYVSALVEVTGGGGFVEQIARDPAGQAVAPCANATSNNWYFADGYTKDASTEDIVVTNPFPDDAIVNFQVATAEGNRRPATLQGYPVRGHSISVIKLESIVRDDAVIAVNVNSTRGRIVVGRAQRYLGAARAGFTMSLGAPALTDQAWFADGETGTGVTERYSIYNGSDNDVSVQAVFLGVPISASFANNTQVAVPAHSVATLDTVDVPGLPAGRHGVVFSTTSAASIVVDRAITRPAGGGAATTVVLGQPPRAAVRRWSMAVGSRLQVADILVVLNVDNQAAMVTVKVLGPGGEVPVPRMEKLPLGPNQVITLGLTDASALGRPLIVESTSRIYVERLLPRDPSLRGRSGSFAMPG